VSTDASDPSLPARPAVDAELVRKTARLARLQIEDADIPKLVDHLEKILDLVGELGISDDTTQSGDSISATTDSLDVEAWRNDEPAAENQPGGPRDSQQIGGNCPDWRDGSFVTPRVVGGE